METPETKLAMDNWGLKLDLLDPNAALKIIQKILEKYFPEQAGKIGLFFNLYNSAKFISDPFATYIDAGDFFNSLIFHGEVNTEALTDLIKDLINPTPFKF